jgi:hypothetical protein
VGKVSIVDKDRGFIALIQRLKEIEDSHVKVGVLSDSEQGGLHVPGADLTVAEIAVVNEFGTSDNRIPERSFVRSTFAEQHTSLAALGVKLIGGIVDGKMTTIRALDIMGSTLATAMKKKITDGAGIPPPNAPSVAAVKQAKGKGAIRTLVDTGRMLGAITWSAIVGGREQKG